MVLPKKQEKKSRKDTKSKSKKKMENSRGKKGKNNKLKLSRISASDGICMSKQLAAKIKRQPKTKSSSKSKSSEPRICGNGKPMPSLAELEKMYEDSDDDSVPHPPQRSITPDQIINKEDESKSLSPRTLKKLSNKVMEIISNLSESIVIEDGPLPVVPPPKVKKSGIPYIVGCKDRPRIPERSGTKSNFGKGDKKYGVDYSLLNVKDEEDEESKKKKRKKSEIPNVQYSIFNAKTDAIATFLRRSEQFAAKYGNAGKPDKMESDSDDSDKTINYADYSPPRKRIRFSPIPSTSTDTEVFLKNDQKFHESLLSMSSNHSDDSSEDETAGETKNTDNEDTDIQIIETPIETIDVDDIIKPNINGDSIDLSISNSGDAGKTKYKVSSSPDIEIIDTSSPIVNSKRKIEEVFEIEDEYERIDFDKLYQTSVDDSEIIDIDELIAQNNRLMEKYQKNTRDVPDVSFHQNNVTNSTPKPVVPPKSPDIPLTISGEDSVVIVSETTATQTKKKKTTNRVLPFTERNTSDSIIFIPTMNSNHQNNVTNSIPKPVVPPKSPVIPVTTSREDSVVIVSETTATQNKRKKTINRVLPFTERNTSDSIIYIPTINSNQSNINRMPNTVVAPTVPVMPVLTEIVSNVSVTTPSAIPVSSNTAITPQKKERECPICMESISKKAPASTICGHIFCMECITVAIKSSGKKCPTCRKKLTGKGYHPLFL